MKRVDSQGVKCIHIRLLPLPPLDHFHRTKIMRRVHISFSPIPKLILLKLGSATQFLKLLYSTTPPRKFFGRSWVFVLLLPNAFDNFYQM